MEGKKLPKGKTRVLAYSRRQRENDTFSDIAQALPIGEHAKDLDKASVLRIAIHYMKLQDMLKDTSDTDNDNDIASNNNCIITTTAASSSSSTGETDSDEVSPVHVSKDILQALDGFLLVISKDGRILYTSESIAGYLGLRQVDVIGVHMHDIIHPQDLPELMAIFQTQGQETEQVFDNSQPLRRNFVVRMRCAFTPSARSITRCSNFKPIYCSAQLKFLQDENGINQFKGIVGFCKPASIARIREMCVGAFFKTKHSLDLSYTTVDTRIRWILGYDPVEMMGIKAYQYFHPSDLQATSSCHVNLLSHGRSHSPCYRFLSHWGEWVWVRSKSFVTYNGPNHMPDGLIIYTWIVRIDEDDDRMKSICAGKNVEDDKKYKNAATNLEAAEGSVDINTLVDAHSPGASNLMKTVEAPSSPESLCSTDMYALSDASASTSILPIQSPEQDPNAVHSYLPTPPYTPFTASPHGSTGCEQERQSPSLSPQESMSSPFSSIESPTGSHAQDQPFPTEDSQAIYFTSEATEILGPITFDTSGNTRKCNYVDVRERYKCVASPLFSTKESKQKTQWMKNIAAPTHVY